MCSVFCSTDIDTGVQSKALVLWNGCQGQAVGGFYLGDVIGARTHLVRGKERRGVQHRWCPRSSRRDSHLVASPRHQVRPGRIWPVRAADGCKLELEDGRRLVDGARAGVREGRREEQEEEGAAGGGAGRRSAG